METREPYKTFADEPCAPLFMVELIDAKGLGQSHGYIGYRFHAVGAQAAADSWNNNRDRGDLVAVIKPVEEPTQIVKGRRDHLALEEIGKLLSIGSAVREDRSVIIQNVRNLVAAIKNPIATPSVSMFPFTPEELKAVSEGTEPKLNDADIVDPTSKLRGHNAMLTRALGACLQAMVNGTPSRHYGKRWMRARQLAQDVMAEVDRHTPFTG